MDHAHPLALVVPPCLASPCAGLGATPALAFAAQVPSQLPPNTGCATGRTEGKLTPGTFFPAEQSNAPRILLGDGSHTHRKKSSASTSPPDCNASFSHSSSRCSISPSHAAGSVNSVSKHAQPYDFEETNDSAQSLNIYLLENCGAASSTHVRSGPLPTTVQDKRTAEDAPV